VSASERPAGAAGWRASAARAGCGPAGGRPRSLPVLLRRRGGPKWAPEPPLEPPPGRILHVRDRGEFFVRDSGGDGPALLLLAVPERRLAGRAGRARPARRGGHDVDRGELSRGGARDISEAGRELGRYDRRPWLAALRVPGAVLVTAEDELVPPRKQRELAALLGVPAREVPGTHLAVVTHAEEFAAALLEALSELPTPATLQGR
jgi:hypothetical protein